MIVTVTPNPSLDRTVELDAPLSPGAVQRATRATSEPGGKGVNISRALAAAGRETLAVLPGDEADPMIAALAAVDVPHASLPTGAPVRTNVTVTDPQGVTTKINEPGAALDDAQVAALLDLAVARCRGAQWAASAGSLPPGAPTDLHARLIAALREQLGDAAPQVAVDSSGPALAAAVAVGPEVIKPNAEELLELAALLTEDRDGDGAPADCPEARLAEAQLEADPAAAVALVRRLQSHGVREALVTLGSRGALLVPADPQAAVLHADGPPLTARSTVGAGDASLAGLLLGRAEGLSAEDALRRAAAHGRAAAALPGSVMPTPDDLDLDAVVVQPLPRRPR